jgi:hypothetical protein
MEGRFLAEIGKNSCRTTRSLAYFGSDAAGWLCGAASNVKQKQR